MAVCFVRYQVDIEGLKIYDEVVLDELRVEVKRAVHKVLVDGAYGWRNEFDGDLTVDLELSAGKLRKISEESEEDVEKRMSLVAKEIAMGDYSNAMIQGIKKLRERTGASLGTCKRVLEEADGKLDTAILIMSARFTRI